MTVLKRRSRMVSFRVSEQEYQNLVALCNHRGARSLSDLTREVMRDLFEAPLKNGKSNGVETEVQKLHYRMEDLDRELKRLAQLVAGSRSPGERQ